MPTLLGNQFTWRAKLAFLNLELLKPLVKGSGKRIFVVDHDACNDKGNAYLSCTWAYISDESNNLFYLCWNNGPP